MVKPTVKTSISPPPTDKNTRVLIRYISLSGNSQAFYCISYLLRFGKISKASCLKGEGDLIGGLIGYLMLHIGLQDLYDIASKNQNVGMLDIYCNFIINSNNKTLKMSKITDVLITLYCLKAARRLQFQYIIMNMVI